MRNKYIMPNIYDFLYYLSDIKIFPKLNITRRYHLVHIKEVNKFKMFHIAHYESFGFTKISFRLINAHVTFLLIK